MGGNKEVGMSENIRSSSGEMLNNRQNEQMRKGEMK